MAGRMEARLSQAQDRIAIEQLPYKYNLILFAKLFRSGTTYFFVFYFKNIWKQILNNTWNDQRWAEYTLLFFPSLFPPQELGLKYSLTL